MMSTTTHAQGQDKKIKFSLFSVQDHYPDLPRTIMQFYHETMNQCVLAENLGFDTFFVAEHHFHEYGTLPNPALFLAAIAQKTNRIRLGTAVSVLPFRNPLTVAEDYAMLDVLSNGRCVLGVGSGYLAHEFAGFGLNSQEKRERFDEALYLLKQALKGEQITFQGKYHQIDNVAINVSPIQQPHPPIFVAILRTEAAYYVGKQGYQMMSIPYASCSHFDEIAQLMHRYQQGCQEHNTAPTYSEAIIALHTYVADSDAAAKQEAATAFDLYVDTRLYARKQTYNDIMTSGLALFGSVDTVVQKIEHLYGMGVRHIAMLYNFGHLPHKRISRSLQHIAQEVIPQVTARLNQETS